MKLIAEVALKMPVSMWDAEKKAESLKKIVFNNPEEWYLTEISFEKYVFKHKDKD